VTGPTFQLADLLDLVADAVPGRTALVHGTTRRTYAALRQRAGRVAAALVDAGIGRGDHVGISLRNRPEYLEVLWGAMWIGAVPVNVDHRYLDAELTHVLDRTRVRWLVHEATLTERLQRLRPALTALDDAVAVGEALEERLAGAGPAPAPEGRSGDDRYLLVTGGTTGAPKGVEWRHHDLFVAALGGGNRFGEPIERPAEIVEHLAPVPNRLLPASPLLHGTACWLALASLLGGSTVVLSPDRSFDAARLLDLVDAEEVSFLVVVGDAFALPVVERLRAEPDRWDLSSLTVVVSGGATLSSSVRHALLELLPWIVVVDGYGTSETGGQITMAYAAGVVDPDGPPRFASRPDTAVLDERLRPVVPGSGRVGRLARRGPLPLGYFADPDATAATFPVVDGVRWAVTGDQATVEADGTIVLLGRGSSTINSGGEKIHPEEVEAVLKSHPAVYDAVVVGVPDARWGERVAAVVSPRRGAAVSVGELVDHCRAHLAAYKTPRAVVIVDAVRRRETGKPDYPWARTVAAGA
jgi:fatty-acyl-CoA synthase